MKTPREILFARHQAAGPKLDAIRRSAVAAVCERRDFAGRRPSAAATLLFQTICRELIWPCRRIWTGLATVWLLLFIVNYSQRDSVSSVTGKPVRPAEVMMSVQTRQRWMNELLVDGAAPPEADRPRNFTPGPRTERSGMAAV